MTGGLAMLTFFGIILRMVILFTLQFYLCGRKKKWTGLILPVICFFNSIYTLIKTLTMGTLSNYSIVIQILITFIVPNINTIVLLLIYYFHEKN